MSFVLLTNIVIGMLPNAVSAQRDNGAIDNYEEENLNVFSRKVLKMIASNEAGWQKMLPEGVSKLIMEKSLFGWEVEEVQSKN